MDWSGLSAAEIAARADAAPLARLMAEAAARRDEAHGRIISYSRKVFVPLTRLCRNVCHYCTFAETPRRGGAAYLAPEEVIAIARAGAAAGCGEVLFTLGDRPELRYAAAREALRARGHATTISYLAAMCERVVAETGLLPHVNPGVMDGDDIDRFRRVSLSMGLMLESAAARLCAPGQVHHGSPDKDPARRLETIRLAGERRVPFTTGILIGIGETRLERIEALLAIAALHREFGHIQEVIVQNFRAKPGTRREGAAEPGLEDLLWTIAVARLIFGPEMNLQAPPNLSPATYPRLIAAGLNDWGGVSPVTPDHVNPEAPWPGLDELARATEAAGKILVQRLPVYPAYALAAERWVDASLRPRLLAAIDADGYARADDWSPGLAVPPLALRPSAPAVATSVDPAIERSVRAAQRGQRLDEGAAAALFAARGADFDHVCRAADELRQALCGDTVSFVVNRNINYTNICTYRCRFCAFSKGRRSAALAGAPYDLAVAEVVARAEEAWARGASEICMQGGIHPDYTGETYLALCRAVKRVLPGLHIHAFSPLEVTHGARTLGLPVAEFLVALRDAGLGTLPGTAAEILDDAVRARICPDKLSAADWLDVVGAAHEAGLRTTATIMFGHVDDRRSWARHLLAIRDLQERTGGFTEFVPLPFVHMEAPLYLKGGARKGPTFREAVLMHAVARLVLAPLIRNIQTSWVKLGTAGARACLAAGVNDLGGTLMNESISRAAGTVHGQEMSPAAMAELILAAGRQPMQRDTLYRPVCGERAAVFSVLATVAA